MSKETSPNSEDKLPKEAILKQLVVQRKTLERQQKTSAIRASVLSGAIGYILVQLTYDSIQANRVSDVALIVEVGTALFIAISIIQFDSLWRELRHILPKYDEWNYILNSPTPGHVKELDIKILSKAYDVNKNVLDKLFEKTKNVF